MQMHDSHASPLTDLTSYPGAEVPGKPDAISIRKNGFNHPVHRIQQRIYELLVGSMTHLCYGTGLKYFNDRTRVLDVGIGNGYMIPRYHDRIKSKGLEITGIDISASALSYCAKRVKEFGLEKQIALHHTSIENFQSKPEQRYDYIFFSQTFMLMTDQADVLRQVRHLISPSGEIVFFQTIHPKKTRFIKFIKPKLKYVTGIDFGMVSYAQNLLALLESQGMQVKENRLVGKSLFQWEYRIIVASPIN